MKLLKKYKKVLKNHQNKLLYTSSHTFFSSYGQTFFISLFKKDIQQHFHLNNSEFGLLYALATLMSSLVLPIPGKKIDTMKLVPYSFLISITLFIAMLIITFAQNYIQLGIGIFLLRLTAQALLPHVATASISRHFRKLRGTFLGITNLGHAIGEGILPVIVTMLLAIFPWNMVFLIFAITILAILIPIVLRSIRKEGSFLKNNAKRTKKNNKFQIKHWSRKQVIKDPFFYLVLPAGVLPAFVLTGLFLFFSNLLEVKNWSLELYSYGFIGFAVFKSLTSFLTGVLIDKFTATRLLPFSLIPLFLGLLGVLYMEHSLFLFIYLIMCGITIGFQMSLKSALWAEVYGTKYLGSIQSIFSTFIFMSTAFAPFMLGSLIESGVNILDIIFYLNFVLLFSIGLSVLALFVKKSSS